MVKNAIIFIIFISIFFPLTTNAHSKNVISGQVARFDLNEKIVTLKIAGKLINVDISNPFLKGYKSIGEIKKNDWINIIYTPDGTIVMRSLKKQRNEKDTEIKPEKKVETKKIFRLTRLKSKGNGFFDVDNNHDKKISPVELSVILPSLTMEKFNLYDRNRDGFLDENEFKEVIKNQ